MAITTVIHGADSGSKSCLEILLDVGANVNATNGDGATALV